MLLSGIDTCWLRLTKPSGQAGAGRSGRGPGGRLPTALSAGLWRGLGAQGLPALAPPKPARGSRTRPPPGPRSASLRVLWHWQTHSRRIRPPPRPSRLRDCQHHRPTQRRPLQRPCHIGRHLPPERRRKGINIYSKGQRLTPLELRICVIFSIFVLGGKPF